MKLWEEALGEVLADGSMERLVSFIWSHNLKRDNPKDKHIRRVGSDDDDLYIAWYVLCILFGSIFLSNISFLHFSTLV